MSNQRHHSNPGWARRFGSACHLTSSTWLRRTVGVWNLLGSLHRKRVPVMLQMAATECGPACLAMILNFYGREVSVAECRNRCGTGRDGASANTLAQIA